MRMQKLCVTGEKPDYTLGIPTDFKSDFFSGDDLVEALPKPCPGCPRDIPVDSPELKEVLGHSIAQLNAENDHPFYYKIDTVKKATSQVCT